MKLFLAAVLCCLISVGPASALFTGNDILKLCTDGNKDADRACLMWMTGLGAGMAVSEAMSRHEKKEPVVCIPDGVNGNQIRMIVENYMRDNPNTLHLPADVIAGRAIQRAFPFPCANAK